MIITRKLYSYFDVANWPTERVPAIDITQPLPAAFTARIYNERLAAEARSIMRQSETPDGLFVRLLLFYQHANREVADDE